MKHRPFIIIALLALLQFNAVARVALTLDPSGKRTAFEYDTNGNLTAVSISMTGRLKFGNNNLTNVSETINSQPSTINCTYDAYNRVSSYHDVYGNQIQYKYDGSGNLTNLVYPGGKNVYYFYDSNNHMTNVTDWAGRKTSITYDLAAHLTSITRPNGTQRAISYDKDGEATNIVELTATGFPIALFRHNWQASGTMQWEFDAPLPHVATVPTRTMSYDADNRLATFNGTNVTVDADGNLTSGPLTNSVFTNYTYDARNRLLNAGGVTNAYDPAGNRVGIVQGTNSTIFVVNPNAKLPQVLMRIKNGVTNYYIYGAGLLYQVTESATATNTLTYHYDYRGSTVALTDGNGNVTDRMEYSLYATTTYRVGTNDTPFLFNGRYGVMTDPNGLLYMRARYYNPYLCRFVNPDPSGFKGGLNFYAAFNGNPVSYTDPTGFNAAATGDTPFSWPQNSATPVDLSNPFSIGTAGTAGNDNYQTVSTALGITSVGNDAVGLSPFGNYTIGINNASGDITLYQSGWATGNGSTKIFGTIAANAEVAGNLLTVGGVFVDGYAYHNGNISGTQFTANTTIAGAAWTIARFGSGPIGAAIGAVYGLDSEDVNGVAAGSFQILTDWYYHAPFGPNFADLPENP